MHPGNRWDGGSLPEVPSLGYVINCKKEKQRGCNVHIMLLIYI